MSIYRLSPPRAALAAALTALVATGVLASPAAAINNGTDVIDGADRAVAFTTTGNVECSGTLIRPEWVLTAGHCVDALHPYTHSVALGGTTSTAKDRRWYPVAGVRRHPKWPHSAGVELDIALVRLSQPVTDVVTFPLGMPTDSSAFDVPSDPVLAWGWGITATNMPAAARLQTKEGTVQPTGSTLKASFVNGGPCHGDSGGPLVGFTAARPIVIGALSQAGCENGDATYVNVASGPAHDWIMSVIGSDSGATGRGTNPWTAAAAPINGRNCYSLANRGTALTEAGYRTSWFVYDPGPTARRVHVRTFGSQMDTNVVVYESVGDTVETSLLRRVTASDDSAGTKQSGAVFTTMADKPQEKVYVIAVGTKSAADTGQECLEVDDAAPVTNPVGGDLVWHNDSTGETQLWYMQGHRVAGRTTVLGLDGGPVLIGAPWEVVGGGDFDGDRKADVVWHNSTTHETQLWYMDGRRLVNRGTVLGTDGTPAFIGPPWRIVAIGDHNADRKADILWYNGQTGETQVWYMNGHRLVTRGTVVAENGAAALIGTPWRIVGDGDMNADFKADIVWYNDQTGETQVWYMNGNQRLSRGTVLAENGAPALVGSPWRIVGIQDMNADLKADIVWYNGQTGETQVWYMSGHQRLSRGTVLSETGVTALIGPPFRIVATGVFNPLG